jgi:hypothetical protein
MPGRKDSLTPGAYFMVPTYLFREDIEDIDAVDADTTAATWLALMGTNQVLHNRTDPAHPKDTVINMWDVKSAVDNRLWIFPSRTDDPASEAGTISIEIWGRFDDHNTVQSWMLFDTLTDVVPRTFNEIRNLPAGIFTLRVIGVSAGTWRIDVSKTGM